MLLGSRRECHCRDSDRHRARILTQLGYAQCPVSKTNCSSGSKSKRTRAKSCRDNPNTSQRAKQLEADFEAELTKTGKQSIKRHGFTLSWVDGRATVKWADEFLKACGAEEANRLKEEAAKSIEKKLNDLTPPAE